MRGRSVGGKTSIKYTVAALGTLIIAGCATPPPIAISTKADGYNAKVEKLAIIYVDNRNAVKTSSSGPRNGMPERIMTKARDDLADNMAKLLPGLVAAAGIDQHFTTISNDEIMPSQTTSGFIATLPSKAPEGRNVMIILPLSYGIRCIPSDCDIEMTLRTELFDRNLDKTVWTAQMSLKGERFPFAISSFAPQTVSNYWSELLRKMKGDGLVD